MKKKNETAKNVAALVKSFRAKLLKLLKESNSRVLLSWWMDPDPYFFKKFSTGKKYIDGVAMPLDNVGLSEIMEHPADFDYVPEDEVKKFATETYPALYKKWKTVVEPTRAEKIKKTNEEIERLKKELEPLTSEQ